MKQIIGLILILAGLFVGVYVGLYLCFIGGTVQIINAIKSPGIPAMPIAWGIAKIFFAGVAGMLSALTLIIPGRILFNSR